MCGVSIGSMQRSQSENGIDRCSSLCFLQLSVVYVIVHCLESCTRPDCIDATSGINIVELQRNASEFMKPQRQQTRLSVSSTNVVPANFLIRLLWRMWAVSNLHSIRAAAGREGARTKDTQRGRTGALLHTQGADQEHTLRGHKKASTLLFKMLYKALLQISCRLIFSITNQLDLKTWFLSYQGEYFAQSLSVKQLMLIVSTSDQTLIIVLSYIDELIFSVLFWGDHLRFCDWLVQTILYNIYIVLCWHIVLQMKNNKLSWISY